jgi:hypothetical protein
VIKETTTPALNGRHKIHVQGTIGAKREFGSTVMDGEEVRPPESYRILEKVI